MSWPPEPSDYYRACTQHRPLFQGDVIGDVPFVKARNGGSPDKDPNSVVERRPVALLGYPCDIYDANGKTVKVQAVAPVVNAQRIGIPDNWDGALNYAPLPDLYGDGEMWAVALHSPANIDATYLDTGKRVRALSENGWATFRQRAALCSTRLAINLYDLRRAGEATWQEIALWEQWNEAGLDPSAFQMWLDERDPEYSGYTRRATINRGGHAAVLAELHAHAQSQRP